MNRPLDDGREGVVVSEATARSGLRVEAGRWQATALREGRVNRRSGSGGDERGDGEMGRRLRQSGSSSAARTSDRTPIKCVKNGVEESAEVVLALEWLNLAPAGMPEPTGTNACAT